MSLQVTITEITANTPVDLYYCDSMSANCVFVSTVLTFPYTFSIPSPYDQENVLIKLIDHETCEHSEFIYITPIPTNTPSPTPSQTPSTTPSTTQTPTPSLYTTPTPSPTNTPSSTVVTTPTPTTNVSNHRRGSGEHPIPGLACDSTLTIQDYYTYINEADLVPVIGVVVYTTNAGGTLYNPFNGNSLWIKLQFGGNDYAVQISSLGDIENFIICP